MYDNLNRVDEAFSTSNAPLSRRLCKDLDSMGPMGQLASLLFKAEKANIQAKSYRGIAPVSRQPYGDYSKDRMKNMLMEVIHLLDAHAKAMDVSWGWKANDKPNSPPWVLCIFLPTGQVSFRVAERYLRSDYEVGSIDDSHNSGRITKFCAGVLDGYWMQAEEDIWE